MKNYNVASAVTVSEERGVISGKYQWLPEMPTGKTELKVSCLILDTVKRRGATGVAVSTERVKWGYCYYYYYCRVMPCVYILSK